METITSLDGVKILKDIHRSNESVVSTVRWTKKKQDGEKEDINVVCKRAIVRNADSLVKFDEEVNLLFNKLIDEPRILTPLAVVRSAPHYSILLPLMKYGSLRDCFHMKRGIPNLQCALSIAIDMCDAVAALHKKNIIHRDIKFANFLIDENFRAFLTDFGSAISADPDTDTYDSDLNGVHDEVAGNSEENGNGNGKKRPERPDTASGCFDNGEDGPSCKRSKKVATTADETQPGITAPSGGFHKQILDGTTLLYNAPEILLNSYPTKESDIYSLAITLCELFTGIIPYDGIEKVCGDLNTVIDASYNEHSLIAAITHDHLRPTLDESTLARRFGKDEKIQSALLKVIDIIKKAWGYDSASRPSALECSKLFQDIVSKCQFNLSNDASVSFDGQTNDGSDGNNGNEQTNGSGKDGSSSHIPLTSSNSHIGGVGVFATSGKRGYDKMEDRYTVTHSIIQDKGKSYDGFCTVVGIFDGHGGANAAEHCSKMFPQLSHQIVHKESKNSEKVATKNIMEAIKKVFLDVDSAFRFPTEESPFYDGSGTTAMVALLYRFPSNSTNHKNEMKLIIANAGDCRAVLCQSAEEDEDNDDEESNRKTKKSIAAKKKKKKNYDSIRLSRDHLASDPEERKRVEAQGAAISVDAKGKTRVQGHIQVTRSIGDKVVKPYGVTAEPEVNEYTLYPEEGDHFVVIGTDGVWDVLNDDQAVKCVLDTAKEPGLAAKRVGSEAFGRGSDDNITAAVMFLSPKYAKNLA